MVLFIKIIVVAEFEQRFVTKHCWYSHGRDAADKPHRQTVIEQRVRPHAAIRELNGILRIGQLLISSAKLDNRVVTDLEIKLF